MVCGCCVALATGCGGSAATRLGAADARALQNELASVETNAAHGERAAALSRLGAIRARLQRLSVSGALGTADAQAMLRAVARASSAAAAELPAVPPAVEAAAASEPPPAAPPAPASPPAATPAPPVKAPHAKGPPPGWLKHGGHEHHRHDHGGKGPAKGDGNGD